MPVMCQDLNVITSMMCQVLNMSCPDSSQEQSFWKTSQMLQITCCTRELTAQDRHRLGREVPAQVVVRRQGVEDAESLKRPAARPRYVTRRGDGHGLVHTELGVMREESQQELGQGLRVGRGRRRILDEESQWIEPRKHRPRRRRLEIVDHEEHLPKQEFRVQSLFEPSTAYRPG